MRFIAGLLDGPPAQALHLSVADGDFGAGDMTGVPVEERVPDYSILKHIDYTLIPFTMPISVMPQGDVYENATFAGCQNWKARKRKCQPLTNLVRGDNGGIRAKERPDTDG